MTNEQFTDWVRLHCQCTGAGADTAQILMANCEIILERWHATYAELCECTQRLFQDGRVPKFPADHPNALARELRIYRTERARETESAGLIAAGRTLKGCDCPRCLPPNGSPKWQAAKARLRKWVDNNGRFGNAIFKTPPNGRN